MPLTHVELYDEEGKVIEEDGVTWTGPRHIRLYDEAGKTFAPPWSSAIMHFDEDGVIITGGCSVWVLGTDCSQIGIMKLG